MAQKLNIHAALNGAIKKLQPRSRDVLALRFGFDRPETLTLAAIGEKYGITRERVRQLEAAAIAEITRKLKAAGVTEQFVRLASAALAETGGVRREDVLLDALRESMGVGGKPALARNRVRFLLESSNAFGYVPEDNAWHAFWYAAKKDRDRAAGAVARLAALFTGQRAVLAGAGAGAAERIIRECAKEEGLAFSVAAQYAAISKRFGTNAYGDFGLTGWPEIRPRTARDWSHLVLRKVGKPLHFSEVSRLVNKMRKERNVHHQTVHNELIKDERFVLVGKGMYGLREQGYVPGVAREVIHRLLKTHGPLPSREVVKRVLQERFFKPQTVLINLQNKKHFVRLDSGEYTIREA